MEDRQRATARSSQRVSILEQAAGCRKDLVDSMERRGSMKNVALQRQGVGIFLARPPLTMHPCTMVGVPRPALNNISGGNPATKSFPTIRSSLFFPPAFNLAALCCGIH